MCVPRVYAQRPAWRSGNFWPYRATLSRVEFAPPFPTCALCGTRRQDAGDIALSVRNRVVMGDMATRLEIGTSPLVTEREGMHRAVF